MARHSRKDREPKRGLAGSNANSVQFLPLAQETRDYISTEVCAYHLNRRPQTLRIWACRQSGPIRPISVHGRLQWPTNRVRELLRMSGAK